MKTCIECGNTYPNKSFYKNKLNTDGRRNNCKYCCREYRIKNKDKLNQDKKNWYQKNKGHVKEYNLIYRKNNAAQIKAAHEEWKIRNRTKWRAIKNAANAEYRASKRNAFVSWADRRKIREIYQSARELTELTGIQFHVDHIIPLKGVNVCGLHWEYNLQILPYYENGSKFNKLIEDIV